MFIKLGYTVHTHTGGGHPNTRLLSALCTVKSEIVICVLILDMSQQTRTQNMLILVVYIKGKNFSYLQWQFIHGPLAYGHKMFWNSNILRSFVLSTKTTWTSNSKENLFSDNCLHLQTDMNSLFELYTMQSQMMNSIFILGMFSTDIEVQK